MFVFKSHDYDSCFPKDGFQIPSVEKTHNIITIEIYRQTTIDKTLLNEWKILQKSTEKLGAPEISAVYFLIMKITRYYLYNPLIFN